MPAGEAAQSLRSMETMEMKPATSLALAVAAVALALTQISVVAVLGGLAIGGIGFALMPRNTIQR